MKKIQIMVRMFDGPAGRRMGDIVSVRQLPFNGWGKEETLPNYLIIEIDTDKEGFKEYEGRHLHINPLDHKSPSKRSKYMLNLDALPKDYAKKRPHLILSKYTVTSNAILRAFT